MKNGSMICVCRYLIPYLEGIYFDYNAIVLEIGKLSEKEGRKAMGLRSARAMIARLPNVIKGRSLYIWVILIYLG
jgi:hypothetical protein